MELTNRQKAEGQECFKGAHTSIHSVLAKHEGPTMKIIGLEGTIMSLDFGTQLFTNNADISLADKKLSLECTKEIKKHLDSMYKTICRLENKLQGN